MTASLHNETASGPVGAYERSVDVYILEATEIAATASSTLKNKMEQTRLRKSRSPDRGGAGAPGLFLCDTGRRNGRAAGGLRGGLGFVPTG